MKVNIFDFPVGSFMSNTALESQLGSLATQGANMYRLVKAGAAIATPAGLAVTSALASGTKSWNVNLPTTAGINCDGVIPAAYGTTTIPISNYFWVQVSGIVPAIIASTTAIGGTALLGTLSANTTGYLAPIASTVAGSDVALGAVGVILNTAVLTASGGTANVQLSGLI